MDKVILLLAGVAIGVGLILFLIQPPPAVKPVISTEGAESQVLKLPSLSRNLADKANDATPHLAIEHPNTVSKLRLAAVPSEIISLSKTVLTAPRLSYPNGVEVYRTLGTPGPEFPNITRAETFVSSPDAAVLSVLVDSGQPLLAATLPVKHHFVVHHPDALSVECLSPPRGLLKEER